MAKSPKKAAIPSLIEHESCLSFKHSKCWNSYSRLKTSREEGAGLGQITRTFYDDGTIRFDSLTNLKRAYPLELKELSWSNVYQRPDLQIRAIVLMNRDEYNYFRSITNEPLLFADSAYNGGRRDVVRSMTACKMSGKCNPKLWLNNTELYNVKSTAPLYGRSAREINNHHVRDVMITRLPKYEKHFK